MAVQEKKKKQSGRIIHYAWTTNSWSKSYFQLLPYSEAVATVGISACLTWQIFLCWTPFPIQPPLDLLAVVEEIILDQRWWKD